MTHRKIFSAVPRAAGGVLQAPDLSRRRFVTGLAAGGLLAGIGWQTGRAQTPAAASSYPVTLRGNSFDLGIGYREVNYTGKPRLATVVNGGSPGPTLRWRQGDTVSVRVSNSLAEDTSIHWHGIILPASMDGVPGFGGFPGIRPGESFEYGFPVVQSGTYWYHSHSGYQEQTGLFGALLIDPAEPEPFSYERDYVVLLSDWSDTDPADIYATLKRESHYYSTHPRTVGDLFRELGANGPGATFEDRAMWNRMRMSDRDIADVTGMTYTFLMNGTTPDDNWTGLFEKGERVRLRIINASAMTIFDVRIPGLTMQVVAADGQYVEPVSVDEFRIGVAETYDVIVTPREGAYTLFAQAMDRSGYARGTLAERPGLQAAVPPLDPPIVLTHADMGMGYAGGHAAGHVPASAASVDHASMNHSSAEQSGSADHSKMDHSAMNHSSMDHNAMDHSNHSPQGAQVALGKAGLGSNAPVTHARTEYGFNVDMRVDAPRDQLGNPGTGLANNGRRVLAYADLKSLGTTADPREPGREIQLHLTGNMGRYMWSIDGVSFMDAAPLDMLLHERLRIVLVNDTMMNHPIHLHGMWSDLETGDPQHIPRKHTVLVQPGSQISYLVTPENPGDWAYHCHLLYHMAGMFRRVNVRGGKA